jgi:hypothetical protein
LPSFSLIVVASRRHSAAYCRYVLASCMAVPLRLSLVGTGNARAAELCPCEIIFCRCGNRNACCVV